MSKTRQRGIQRPPVYRWLLLQGGVAILISLAFWLAGGDSGEGGSGYDWVSGYSALLGGLIFVVPNSYFAFKVFAHSGARAAPQIMGSFYRGEAGKLILCAILFAVVFKFVRPIDVTALFSTFAVMLVTNWLTPLFLTGSMQRR